MYELSGRQAWHRGLFVAPGPVTKAFENPLLFKCKLIYDTSIMPFCFAVTQFHISNIQIHLPKGGH
jgi:hypothetical protein